MTSSSKQLLLSVILAACSEVRTTGIQLGSAECAGGELRTMNTYVITLFEAGAREGECTKCGMELSCKTVEERCILDHQDDPRLARAPLLADVLAGERFEGVNPDAAYCIRVIALSAPTLDESTCIDDLHRMLDAVPYPDGPGRICGFSTLSGTNSTGITLDSLACSNDANFGTCVELRGDQP